VPWLYYEKLGLLLETSVKCVEAPCVEPAADWEVDRLRRLAARTGV
jgi:hypothetical protein